MRSVIWKYSLAGASIHELAIPAGARVLSVQHQRDVPVMWVLLRPDAPTVTRKFRVFGTGETIDLPVSRLQHLGTVQEWGGTLIWHVFEVFDE